MPALWLAVGAMASADSLFAAELAAPPQDAGAAPQDAAAAAQQPQFAPALPPGKKLVLADGSYQLVREYQREGDRVRYYSVERSAWEEIPASLVDWAATEQAVAQQQAAVKALDEKLKAADRAAAVANIDSDRSYEVRPGVILPDDAGLYALAENQVKALEQDLAVSRADKARAAERIASGVPLIHTRAWIEIKPRNARLRIRAGEVEFYFRPANERAPKVQLLKADVLNDRRKLDTVSTNIVGQNNYKGNEIPLMISEAARGLYRLVPDQALKPGEYALVQMSAEGTLDLYVWDFGIDMAPANAEPFLRNTSAK